MLELDWAKLVIIGVVALVVIGPKELPAVLRTVGQWVTKVRRMAAEFQDQFQEAMREAELADLKKHADTITDAANQLATTNFDPIDTARKEIQGAIEGSPEPPRPPESVEPAAPATPANPGSGDKVATTATPAASAPTEDATPVAAPEPAVEAGLESGQGRSA